MPAWLQSGLRLALPLVLGTLALGCGQGSPGAGGKEPPKADGTLSSGRPGSAERGAKLYAANRARCHGERGEGRLEGNATALNNQDFLAIATDNFLRQTTLVGRPGTAMPAWARSHGGSLGDQEIEDLVALLRSWQKVPARPLRAGPVRGDPRQGGWLYATKCANCHGPEGKGLPPG